MMESNQQDIENDPDILKVLTSSQSRSRRIKRYILWSLPVLLAFVLLSGWLAGSSENGNQYTTQPAIRGSLSVTVTATGNLEPINQVDVGSELSGTMNRVEVDYNDRVKKGQALARLDTSKLQAQVLQSRASLESAESKVLQACATVKEAKSKVARLRHLGRISDNRAVSPYDLDSAEAALARATADEANCRAEVSLAKAVLEANETDLSKSVIRSPVNGIVLTRSVEPGQTVAATLQAPVLFTLAEDLTKMRLLVDVDEADVGDVKDGQNATFTVDAYPGRRFPAKITQVRFGAKTKNSVVTYKAVLNVDNSDLSLRPGMTATAEITIDGVEDAVLVPNAALRFTPPRREKEENPQAGGIMSKIIPHPPAPPSSKKSENKSNSPKGQCLWVLRNGEPASVSVKTGVTDGTYTVVEDGAVEPGTQLVLNIVSTRK